MTEKLGQSCSDSGLFDVHILGFPTTGVVHDTPTLHHHSLERIPFGRFSWRRIIAPLKVLKKVLVLKPDFFIITTHELLLAAMVSKALTGCNVIYDVQENHYRNIIYTKTFPILIRQILGFWVRIKEVLCAPAITLFILAEKCYISELPFARPFLVSENKLTRAQVKSFSKKSYSGYCKILFTGTLAETTGVINAIEITRQLHKLDRSVTLTIIGSCASQDIFNRITALSHRHEFIKFQGKRYPVPHTEILNEIVKADFGIIYYPFNSSTSGSIPTKLYEYQALGLPILIQHSEEASRVVTENNAGIQIPENPVWEDLLEQMKSFTPGNMKPSGYWDEDFYPVLQQISQY